MRHSSARSCGFRDQAVMAVLHQDHFHILAVITCSAMRSAVSHGTSASRWPVQQTDRTINRDGTVQQQVCAAILDQRVRDGVGFAVLVRHLQNPVESA